MDGRLGEILIGGLLVGALWLWLQYSAWGGVRYQRRSAWLRPALMRRVQRAARRKQRALDHEIRRFQRRAGRRPIERPGRASQAGRGTDRTQPSDPDTLKRQQGQAGPTHRKPGQPR